LIARWTGVAAATAKPHEAPLRTAAGGVYDRARAVEITGGEAQADQIWGLLIQRLPKDRETLRKARASADPEALRRLAHTLRQVPEMLAIAQDMERLCPDAWLINFTNPVPRLCLATSRYSRIRTVGLCHQINIAYMMVGVALAGRLGIDVPSGVSSNPHPDIWPKARHVAHQVEPLVDIRAAGLNHFSWILEIRHRQTGEDLYPAFREAFRALPADFEPFTRAVYEATGLCAVPGDCHLAEYLPWCHDPQARPWEKYNLFLYDWDRAQAERDKMWRTIEGLAQGSAPLDELREARGEGAVELIEGLLGTEDVYRPAVNIPNRGDIPNLPDEAIVEVPALVGGGESPGSECRATTNDRCRALPP